MAIFLSIRTDEPTQLSSILQGRGAFSSMLIVKNHPTASANTQLFALVVLVILYAAGYLIDYMSSPLGQVPLLDSRETLDLAEDIASGTLPAEPFYRMPLYAAMLAWTHIPAFVFNFLCHLTSTVLIYHITRRLFYSQYGPFVAGLLYGVNPVVLYFVGDPLDVTFGICLMVVGLYFVSEALSRIRVRSVVLAAIFFTLAGFARGHLLVLACFWPCAVYFLAKQRRISYMAYAALPLCLGFLAFGGINYRLSSKWHLLPTQGAYNFYAANKIGSHGRYFTQDTRSVNLRLEGNPTRAESLELYSLETGKTPSTLTEVNSHWRSKIVESFLAEPLEHSKQFLWKLYYLFNDKEQYNNKTYEVHKELSPWLRFNPIGFGLLLGLCYFGVLLNYKKGNTFVLAALFDVYMLGVLLFFVSARFRLPLVVFMAIFAGAILAYQFKKPFKKISFYMAILGALVVLGITFSNFGSVGDKRSHAEDYALLSGAEFQLGNDASAALWAERALEVNPAHLKALELLCLSQFNHLLSTRELPSRAVVENRVQQFAPLSAKSVQVRHILAFYLYQLGQKPMALELWHSLLSYRNEARMDAAVALSALGVPVDIKLKPAEVEAFELLLKLPLAE